MKRKYKVIFTDGSEEVIKADGIRFTDGPLGFYDNVPGESDMLMTQPDWHHVFAPGTWYSVEQVA